jgi:hypothetical protein
MKQYRQSHIGIGWLVASAIALTSAGAIADSGNVNSGGRSVNEVQGRASGSLPGARTRAVNTTGLPAVSEVYGRGSQMSGGAALPSVSARWMSAISAAVRARWQQQPESTVRATFPSLPPSKRRSQE